MVTKTRYPLTIEGETADVGTAAELVVALDVLQGEHDRRVLEQLRPHLHAIIGHWKGLIAVFLVLNPEDRSYLIEALGEELVTVLQDAQGLCEVLSVLAVNEVERRLLDTLGAEGLRTLVETPEELSAALEWIYGECDALALELLGPDWLKRHFQNGYQLSIVLNALHSTLQESLIDTLGWDHVAGLALSSHDLAYMLRALPSDLSKQFLRYFTKEQLWRIIHSKHGWRQLYGYLEEEEAAYLSALLEVSNDAE